MPTQIVMNHYGDTRHHFEAHDVEALAKAEERFKQLTGEGFTAAIRTKPGEVARINSFDPKAEETVFFPRLIGGEPVDV
jgi:Na+-transporting NADH:ubiquinone oxidoreductase subunit NqrA